MSNLAKLKKEILADGIIDGSEVKRIEKVLYEDGKIDRNEANFIFSLNDAVSGKKNSPNWNKLFVKALTDHFLKNKKSFGKLDEKESEYLIKKIKSDNIVDKAEQDLILNILSKAKSTPKKFQTFVFSTFKKIILEDGKIDPDEVKVIKKIIYGVGGSSGKDVDCTEANWLFDLNDAVSGKKNHFSWKKLMVDAISSHLLNDKKSPGVIDDSEAKWLVKRIQKDGKLDSVEKEILVALKKKAKKISKFLKV